MGDNGTFITHRIPNVKREFKFQEGFYTTRARLPKLVGQDVKQIQYTLLSNLG